MKKMAINCVVLALITFCSCKKSNPAADELTCDAVTFLRYQETNRMVDNSTSPPVLTIKYTVTNTSTKSIALNSGDDIKFVVTFTDGTTAEGTDILPTDISAGSILSEEADVILAAGKTIKDVKASFLCK
jgi:hypothetical protein